METTLRQDITNIGADPDFVEFVMAWHGEIGSTDVPFTTEKESDAYLKKVKRWTKRGFRAEWKWYWKVILNECFKARRKMVLRRNLFRLEPRGPNPSHHPRNEGRWNAIFDLRHYFKKRSGRVQMALLCRLFHRNDDVTAFKSEWHKRKEWFESENSDARLGELEGFYQVNRMRILETLETGVPFYAKWEGSNSVTTPSLGMPQAKPA